MIDLQLLLNTKGVYYGLDDRAHIDMMDLYKANKMSKRSCRTLATVNSPL
jgi:hypothetical protein